MAISNRWVGRSVTAGIVVLAACAAPGVTAGDFYRWVDRDGEVHYTDAPPPESVQAAPSGTADTEADRQEREARAEAERAAADEEARARRHDQMLRQSYTTVEDLERTRDRRLEGVQGEIGLAKHRVESAQRKLEQYDNLLAHLPEDNEHRAEMVRQREEVLDRLERRRHELGALREKRERMEARFARDIERYLELTADSAE